MTTEIYHRICGRLREIVRETEWEGHIFAVGGCCRDEVMGYPIKDLDMAVDLPNGGIAFARWLEEKGLTKGGIVTYPRFGTAALSLREFPDDEIQIVQTRKEKYTDRNSRCPETAFGDIREDCMRRDLTINSLYYDICRRRVVDITGRGLKDIEDRIIRTPMAPDTTFDDDPVRIYRTIRFAARFGWDIDGPTYEAILRNIPRLKIVTPTRCHTELDKMLSGPNPVRALDMLMETGAMAYLLPDLWPAYSQPEAYGDDTVWRHTSRVLAMLEGKPSVLMMAGLLHDIGKPLTASRDEEGRLRFQNHDQTGSGLARRSLRRLRYDRAFIDDVDFLVRHHLWTKAWGPDASKMKDRQLRKLQYICVTRERFGMLLDLIDADHRARLSDRSWDGQAEAIMRRSLRMEEEGTAMFGYKLPVPSILIKRIKGLRDAKAVKRCRDYLLKQAFINPKRSASEFKKLLMAFK
ncbi:MAG: HD domain-containing protein [Duncaniella sp.]|nr:HD domain-containing protein [Duncaniella sp.]